MNYYIGGLSPYGYHVVNVVLHTAVTLLFMLTYRQVAPRENKMELVIAGAVFAVHPVHVEAVRTVRSCFKAAIMSMANLHNFREFHFM